MSGLVKIPINLNDIDIEKSIWEQNTQLKYFSPYGDLYDNDQSEGKLFSSRQMWCIVLFHNPDDEQNIFFRYSPKERKEKISEKYGKDVDWEDEYFLKCLNAYPHDCMTMAQRALAMEKDKLIQVAELIRDTELTLDTNDDKGKLVKGTALQINILQKGRDKIYEEYMKVEAMFIQEKQKIRAKGGGGVESTAAKNIF